MSEIDKTSLGWVGYLVMCVCHGLNEESAERNWPLNEENWTSAAKAIEAEVIRRYTALHGQPEEAQEFKPPRYGNFLEVTRDLCR